MFHIHTFTEAGGHPVNEDSFGVRPHPADGSVLLVALADGMGGQPGGGPASALAVRAAFDSAALISSMVLMDRGWTATLLAVDGVVRADKEAGFTTLIGLSIRGNEVSGASCGDSAVLAIDGQGRLHELTRDQWKDPPVGSGETFFIPFAAELAPPWKLLVMSDGVWKYVGWERLIDTAKTHNGPDLVQELQNAARLKGSGTFQDDFTLIVIQDAD